MDLSAVNRKLSKGPERRGGREEPGDRLRLTGRRGAGAPGVEKSVLIEPGDHTLPLSTLPDELSPGQSQERPRYDRDTVWPPVPPTPTGQQLPG